MRSCISLNDTEDTVQQENASSSWHESSPIGKCLVRGKNIVAKMQSVR